MSTEEQIVVSKTEGRTPARTRGLKSPKSRSGCLTCKQKRLKCDEAKPACFQCVKRDITCPGYTQVIKWKRATNVENYNPKPRKKRVPHTTVLDVRQSKSEKSDDAASNSTAPTDISASTQTNAEKQKDISNDSIHVLNHDGITAGAIPWPWDDMSSSSFDDMSRHLENDTDFIPIPPVDLMLSMNVDPFSLTLDTRDSMITMSSCLEPPIIGQDTNTNELLAGSIQCSIPSPASSRVKNFGSNNTQSLLRTFYRMEPSLLPPLVSTSTKLVEYYFSTICGLYSCFDSPSNPFRSMVSQVWSTDASTYYAIQSMSAAHLGNELPHMRDQGIILHHKASKHLAQDVYKCCLHDRGSDQPLLNMLLLGLSASWQQPHDLGLPYLRTARSLTYAYLVRADESRATLEKNRFFEEAMIYWEMMMSFVRDEDDVITMHLTNEDSSISSETSSSVGTTSSSMPSETEVVQGCPHPWTGICPKAQMLLAEVGRLCRRVRVGPDKGGFAEAQYFHLALELEETLLALNMPSPGSTIDSGDPQTKKQDFINLAQATRDCGLLELYRVFPELLRRRQGLTTNRTSPFDLERSHITTWPLHSRIRWQSHLTTSAIRILTLLESIPDSSGVRAQQLFLLMIAASELRLPTFSSPDVLQNSSIEVEISCARRFARTRLSQLAIQLPAQPAHVMMKLLLEVWRRMDAQAGVAVREREDIFWIDVMVEKGWHTIMG